MINEDLEALYVSELQEARSFEAQIADGTHAILENATDPALRETLGDQILQAKVHAKTVSALIEAHEATPEAHEDQAMQALLTETRRWCGAIGNATVRDAALIASAQRIGHYKIAVYGSLVAWAEQLGLGDADVLRRVLDEEKDADAALSDLAQRAINPHAVA